MLCYNLPSVCFYPLYGGLEKCFSLFCWVTWKVSSLITAVVYRGIVRGEEFLSRQLQKR